MPVSNQSINKEVFSLLRSRGFDPIPLDSKGQQDIDIEDSDVFRFDFKEGDDVIGTAWVTVEGKELVFYIGDDLASHDSFLNFLQFLKRWSQRKLLGFKITNKDHLSSDMKKRTSMKNKEQLGEAYHPMGKKASYNDSVPQVKIILQHTRQLEEGEQRFRNIAKIFVENTNGERFLLPTIRPGLARVYARHIAEGGTPYDDRAKHITTLVEEYTKMAGFVRATKNSQFHESAQRLVSEGLSHYSNLRETLTRMASHRGYKNYFESYTPVLNEEVDDEASLNELFVQETLDPRIESVMPILKRLQKNITEMNEVRELEEWAQSILEVEDETTKTLAEPASEMLDEAPGAETLKHNQNTEKSNLKAFDLDEAEEDSQQKKKEKNDSRMNKPSAPQGDKVDIAKKTAKDMISKADRKKTPQNFEKNANIFRSLLGIGLGLSEGFTDPNEAASQIIDSIGGEENLTSDDVFRAVQEYQMMMDSPHKIDVDEVAQIVMDHLNIHDEIQEEINPKVYLVTSKGTNKVVGTWNGEVFKPFDRTKYPAGIMDKVPNDCEIDKVSGPVDKSQLDMQKAVHEEELDEAQTTYFHVVVDGVSKGKFKDAVKAKEMVAAMQKDFPNKKISVEKKDEFSEDLDANQKRAGQLGPTEKVGPKGAVGKLVGANESLELSEMDKSQPSSDRGGESSGNPYAKGGKATPAKAKDAEKDAEKVLNKSMDKAHKKDVKEGQEDLDAILRIVRK